MFGLTLEMPGRLNYTQLERMGSHTEKTYREAFSKDVDWAKIDEEAIFRVFSRTDSLSIVIDPSFLQKAGPLRFNSRYAGLPTSRKLAYWDQFLRKLAGTKALSA